jgi:hypothetical protein
MTTALSPVPPVASLEEMLDLSDLPESLSDPRFAIADPQLAALVAAALSRFICLAENKLGVHVYDLGHVLSRYAVTALNDSPAPIPTYDPAQRTRRAVQARKQAGITWDEEKRIWAEAERAHGETEAHLPIPLLCHYFPPPLWAVVAAVIEDGPARARERLVRLLDARIDEPVRQSIYRPDGGKPSQATIENWAQAFRRLMAHIKDLADSGHSGRDYLVTDQFDWRHLPRNKMPRRRGANRPGAHRMVAPPRHVLRRVMQELDAEIGKRLGADPRLEFGARDEVALMRSAAAYRRAGLFTRVRDRAALSLIIGAAPRDGSLAPLDEERHGVRRCDYVEEHRGPAGTGPALRLFPGKTIDADEEVWQPLHPGLALRIDSYLAFIETELGRPLPPEGPLLIAREAWPDRYWSDMSIRSKFAGVRPRENFHGTKALICADPATNPHIGYPPHTLRKAAQQMIESPEASEWLEERGLDPHLRRHIGKALLNHGLSSDISDLYAGHADPLGRELLAALGSEIVGDLLLSERGARKAPRVAEFEDVVQLCRALQERISRLQDDKRELWLEAERKNNNGEREKAMEIVLLRVKGIESELADLAQQLNGRRERMQELRLNRREREAVPDSLSEAEYKALLVDLDQVERRVLEGRTVEELALRPAVRNLLTPAEVAEILNRGESTVRRWLQDGQLPERDRILFKEPYRSSGELPVHTFSAKRRAFYASAIDLSRLVVEQQDIYHRLRSQDWPERWSGLPKNIDEPQALAA